MLIALTPLLGACETSAITDRLQDMMFDFNPFGTKKKPLPGDRKPVFPEGIPGVQQGIPPELMQGYQPPQEPEPKAEETKKEPPKSKKPRQAKRPPQGGGEGSNLRGPQ